MVKSPGRCSHCCGRVTLQGQVTWARAREKGYHLTFYLHFISPLTPHYWCRVAALLSQTSRDHSCGRVTRQVLMRGKPLDHRCGRVAKLALERRRVQQRCPRAPTPEPGEGRRPKNRQSQRRKVFLPGCSVFSLSWPACAWSLLVPVRWFSGPAPSGSSLFWFRLMFLSIGRGRRVPAPSGRDVGSSAVAPTQEPAQGADPRTGFCRYPSAYGFVVYLVAPGLFFPLHFAYFIMEVLALLSLYAGTFWETRFGQREFLNDSEFQRLVHPSRQFIPSSCVSSFARRAESHRQRSSVHSQARRFFPRSLMATQLLRDFFGKCASFCGYGEVCALAECVPFCATHACFEETGHFDTELNPSSLLAPNASIAKKCCTDRLAQRA